MSSRRILGARAWMILAAALISMLLLQVGVVRLLCAAAFCLLAPGYGWARRMRSNDGDGGDVMAMAVTFSICATTAVGTAMAVFGLWSPVAGFAVLVLISVAGFMPFRRNTATHKKANIVAGTIARGRGKLPGSPAESYPRVHHDHGRGGAE